MNNKDNKIIIAITENIQVHLIISEPAEITIRTETDYKINDIKELAYKCYNNSQIYEDIASGSFKNKGMIIAPCSISTMSAIESGNIDNLICRAADVALKERRKLILMVRETPFHLGHLQRMTNLTSIGAIIFPPIPTFYNKPKTIDDIILQSVGRVLDLLDIEHNILKRWNGIIKENND
jgi:flavin prenyltransferase